MAFYQGLGLRGGIDYKETWRNLGVMETFSISILVYIFDKMHQIGQEKICFMFIDFKNNTTFKNLESEMSWVNCLYLLL